MYHRGWSSKFVCTHFLCHRQAAASGRSSRSARKREKRYKSLVNNIFCSFPFSNLCKYRQGQNKCRSNGFKEKTATTTTTTERGFFTAKTTLNVPRQTTKPQRSLYICFDGFPQIPQESLLVFKGICWQVLEVGLALFALSNFTIYNSLFCVVLCKCKFCGKIFLRF